MPLFYQMKSAVVFIQTLLTTKLYLVENDSTDSNDWTICALAMFRYIKDYKIPTRSIEELSFRSL